MDIITWLAYGNRPEILGEITFLVMAFFAYMFIRKKYFAKPKKQLN